MFDYDVKYDWQADGESDWHYDLRAELHIGDNPEPPVIIRGGVDPMAKIGRFGMPWTTLTLLIVPIGAVIVAFGPLIAAVVVLIAAAALVGQWGWRVVSSYSRKQGRD